MEIYLMQHGDCFSSEEDQEQSLTPKGEEQIRASAHAMKRMGIKLDVIVASPKKRSIQTAGLVAEVLGLASVEIVKTNHARPSAKAVETVEFLAQYANRGAVLVTGHLPSLAETASFLLTDGPKAAIRFQRGGICRIDVESLPTRSGELCWHLTPEQLRFMAQ